MTSILEQYRISDFLEWFSEKKLILNPDFQRRNVWTPDARSYLIDTILRQLPIPKIFIRTKIDVASKRSFREVVDGQQRLRAIIEFANDKFRLGKRAGEFYGEQFSTLSPELQEKFLSYPIAVDQLVNASVDDVLEVFARLNSYSVSLAPAEIRHAKYQGDFKWTVYNSSIAWKILWDKYNILSVRERVRMQDDQLTAEMYGIILEGVTDGGQPRINSLYSKYDTSFSNAQETTRKFDEVLTYFDSHIGDGLLGTPVLRSPHFLMLFGALAHAIVGIPNGNIPEGVMPFRDPTSLSNLGIVESNLLKLASIIESEESIQGFEDFWKASKSTTQRISSRKARFPVYFDALLPKDI